MITEPLYNFIINMIVTNLIRQYDRETDTMVVVTNGTRFRRIRVDHGDAVYVLLYINETRSLVFPFCYDHYWDLRSGDVVAYEHGMSQPSPPYVGDRARHFHHINTERFTTAVALTILSGETLVH